MPESTVKDIMTVYVTTLPVDSNVREAALLMLKGRISSLVATQKGNPVGMVTERDIVGKVVSEDVNPSKISVEEIMSRPIITIPQEETIEQAALVMSIYGIKRLVVVDIDGKLSGMITTTDIAAWLSTWTCSYASNWKHPPCPGECVLFYNVNGLSGPWLVVRRKDHPLEELYKDRGFAQVTADEFLVLEVHES